MIFSKKLILNTSTLLFEIIHIFIVEDLCHQGTHCMNGGTCVYHQSMEFKCLCPDGFHGENCEGETKKFIII